MGGGLADARTRLIAARTRLAADVVGDIEPPTARNCTHSHEVRHKVCIPATHKSLPTTFLSAPSRAQLLGRACPVRTRASPLPTSPLALAPTTTLAHVESSVQ